MSSEQNKEDQDNEFGWKFHRGPLIASIIVTAVFYILIFIYVAIE